MPRDLSLNDWICTASGRPFWPLDPRPEDVHAEDLAAHLAHVNRFTGAAGTYSVAEHCVRVSIAVEREARDAGFYAEEIRELALWGLLHDASEAYLCDVARPLKRQAVMEPYRVVEGRVQAAVCQRFGLPVEEPGIVKRFDRVLLRTEQRDLMPPALPGEDRSDAEPLPERIVPWHPDAAHAAFLERLGWLVMRRAA